MGKRMAKVCTPRQGTIHRPSPVGKWLGAVAIRPRKRDQWVAARRTWVARQAFRVRFSAYPLGPGTDITTPKARYSRLGSSRLETAGLGAGEPDAAAKLIHRAACGARMRNSSMMAGPRVTKMMEGRTNRTRGTIILMVVLAACSSARWRRSVRSESE